MNEKTITMTCNYIERYVGLQPEILWTISSTHQDEEMVVTIPMIDKCEGLTPAEKAEQIIKEQAARSTRELADVGSDLVIITNVKKYTSIEFI